MPQIHQYRIFYQNLIINKKSKQSKHMNQERSNQNALCQDRIYEVILPQSIATIQKTLNRILIQTKILVDDIVKKPQPQKNKDFPSKQSNQMNQQSPGDQSGFVNQEYAEWNKWAFCQLKPQTRDLKISIPFQKHIQQLKKHLRESEGKEQQEQQEEQKKKKKEQNIKLIDSLVAQLKCFVEKYHYKLNDQETKKQLEELQYKYSEEMKKIKLNIQKSEKQEYLQQNYEQLLNQLINYIRIEKNRNSVRIIASEHENKDFQQLNKNLVRQLNVWLKILQKTPTDSIYSSDPLLTCKQKRIIRSYISRMYQLIFSDTLQKYRKDQLDKETFKVYCSKNLIFNIHNFFRELIKLYKQKQKKEEKKEREENQKKIPCKIKFNRLNVIFDFINKQSQLCIEYLVNKYPQSSSSQSSYILQKNIQTCDFSNSDRFDMLFTNKQNKNSNKPKIQFGQILQDSKQNSGYDKESNKKNKKTEKTEKKINKQKRYISQIMESINYVTQLCHKPIQGETVYSNQNAFHDIMISIFNRAEQIKKQINPETNLDTKNQANSQAKSQSLKSLFERIFKINQIQKADKKQIHYKIGLKCHQQEIFTQQQIKNQIFISKNRSMLRILTKWVDQLSKKFKNNFQNLHNRYQKIKTRRGQLTFLNDKQIVFQAKIKHNQIKQKLNDLKKNFVLIQTEILNSLEAGNYINSIDTNINLIGTRTQMCMGNYMMIHLNDIIQKLVKLAENIDSQKSSQYKKGFDFVTFKISDLMRAKCWGRASQLVKIYQCFKKVSNLYPEILQIVKVNNRLKTNNNDVLINLMFNQKILCEVQLSVQKFGSEQSKSAKQNQFNHYLYQLKRSIFGVIAESCNILSKSDPSSKNFSFYQPKKNQSISYIKQHKEIINNRAQLKGPFLMPYICSQCKSLKSNNKHFILDDSLKSKCYQCFQNQLEKTQNLQNSQNQLKKLMEKCLFNLSNLKQYKLIFPKSCNDIPQNGIIIPKHSKERIFYAYEKINYPKYSSFYTIIKKNEEKDTKIFTYEQNDKQSSNQKLNQYYFIFNPNQNNIQTKQQTNEKIKQNLDFQYIKQASNKDTFVFKDRQYTLKILNEQSNIKYLNQARNLHIINAQKEKKGQFKIFFLKFEQQSRATQEKNNKFKQIHIKGIKQTQITIPSQINRLQQFRLIDCQIEKLELKSQMRLSLLEIFNVKKLSFFHLKDALNLKTLLIKKNQCLADFIFSTSLIMSKLKTLIVSDNSSLKELISFKVLTLPKLKNLSILSNQKLQRIDLPQCPQLKQFTLTDNDELKHISFDNLPQIKKIIIKNNYQLTQLKLPAQNCMQDLILYNNRSVKQIILQKATQLKIIRLRYHLKLEHFTIPQVNKIQKLEYEKLDKFVPKLENLKYLKILYLNNIKLLEGELKIPQMNELQQIVLYNMKIKELVFNKKHPNLKKLRLESCPNLQKIDIPQANNLNLELLNNKKIVLNEQFFEKLKNKAPKIKSLNFSQSKIQKLKLLESKIIKFICEKNSLKEVNIQYCEALSQLYLNNSSIEKLDLKACRQLEVFQSNIQPQEIHIKLSKQKTMQSSPFWLTIINMLESIYQKLIKFQFAESLVYVYVSCQWGQQIKKQSLQWQIICKTKQENQKQLKRQLDNIADLKYKLNLNQCSEPFEKEKKEMKNKKEQFKNEKIRKLQSVHKYSILSKKIEEMSFELNQFTIQSKRNKEQSENPQAKDICSIVQIKLITINQSGETINQKQIQKYRK